MLQGWQLCILRQCVGSAGDGVSTFSAVADCGVDADTGHKLAALGQAFSGAGVGNRAVFCRICCTWNYSDPLQLWFKDPGGTLPGLVNACAFPGFSKCRLWTISTRDGSLLRSFNFRDPRLWRVSRLDLRLVRRRTLCIQRFMGHRHSGIFAWWQKYSVLLTAVHPPPQYIPQPGKRLCPF